MFHFDFLEPRQCVATAQFVQAVRALLNKQLLDMDPSNVDGNVANDGMYYPLQSTIQPSLNYHTDPSNVDANVGI